MMDIFNFIFLGILQGITEPLPISSSGHLFIAQSLLNIDIPGISFEAFINFGSTIAILYYFRDKLSTLIKGLFKKDKEAIDYIIKIIIATIPLEIAGVIIIIYNLNLQKTIFVIAYKNIK